MTCGCRIKVDHLNPENYFVAELLRCPLHEAAGEMLKALNDEAEWLEEVIRYGSTSAYHKNGGFERRLQLVRAAIAKAEKR